MKTQISIILLIIFLYNISFSQDFGCYDIYSDSNGNNILDGIYTREHTSYKNIYEIDWTEFSLDSNISNGYYKKYYFNKDICSESIKMEGNVQNGFQEGVWKLYLNTAQFYKGNYINGKKEGLWIGYYINDNNDTLVFSKIEFKNNYYNGIAKLFYPNSKVSKTFTFKNGYKNGQEIEYFENDTSEIKYIRELKEYTNGLLNGKYLIYKYDSPFDTLIFGMYSNGKKNGRFITFDYNGTKYITDFVNNKVEGKVIKYFNNGNKAYEFDYKNNLPYNLIVVNDTSGKPIKSNTLNKGTGKLYCYYKSGKIHSCFQYKNQLISGKFNRYYSSGKIMEEGFIYTDNKDCFKKTKPLEQCKDINLFSAWQLNFVSGTNYIMYNENGIVQTKIFSSHSDSLKNNIIILEKYDEGKLISTENIIYGLRFGLFKEYYANDSIKLRGNFIILDNDSVKTSVKDGLFNYYYSNGKLKATITYSKGKEIGRSYFYNDLGILKRTKVIENNGAIYNIYDKDTVNCIDKKGRKQGKWISFPSSYYLKEKCYSIPNEIKFYKNDKPIGIWEYYDYGGSKLVEKIIWKDTINAYSIKWGYNGKLIEEGKMINQIKNGEWKEYDNKKGYLKYKGRYDCGVKTGIWEEFKRNGKIIKKIEYINGHIKTPYNNL